MANISVDEIKQYNQNLRALKDKAAKVDAEIAFNQSELQRLCQELSAECGVTVTPENIESIRNDYIEKVQGALASGKEILARILADETGTQVAYEQPATPVQQQQQPVYAAEQYAPPMQPQYTPATTQAQSVFSGLPGQTVMSPVSAIPNAGNTAAIVI